MKKLIKKLIRKLFAKKYEIGEIALYGGKVAVRVIGIIKKDFYTIKTMAKGNCSTAYGWQLKKIKAEKREKK